MIRSRCVFLAINISDLFIASYPFSLTGRRVARRRGLELRVQGAGRRGVPRVPAGQPAVPEAALPHEQARAERGRGQDGPPRGDRVEEDLLQEAAHVQGQGGEPAPGTAPHTPRAPPAEGEWTRWTGWQFNKPK